VRNCTICHHPERKDIERAILSTEKGKDIAARHGVSPHALSRHRTGHMAVEMAATMEERRTPPGTLYERLEQLYDRAVLLLNDAMVQRRPQVSLAAIKELRQLVELLGKFTGELDTRPQVNIIASPDWLRVRGVLLEVLADYPEARAAVAGRLLELEARK
jgi:hypothetical protein